MPCTLCLQKGGEAQPAQCVQRAAWEGGGVGDVQWSAKGWWCVGGEGCIAAQCAPRGWCAGVSQRSARSDRHGGGGVWGVLQQQEGFLPSFLPSFRVQLVTSCKGSGAAG